MKYIKSVLICAILVIFSIECRVYGANSTPNIQVTDLQQKMTQEISGKDINAENFAPMLYVDTFLDQKGSILQKQFDAIRMDNNNYGLVADFFLKDAEAHPEKAVARMMRAVTIAGALNKTSNEGGTIYLDNQGVDFTLFEDNEVIKTAFFQAMRAQDVTYEYGGKGLDGVWTFDSGICSGESTFAGFCGIGADFKNMSDDELNQLFDLFYGMNSKQGNDESKLMHDGAGDYSINLRVPIDDHYDGIEIAGKKIETKVLNYKAGTEKSYMIDKMGGLDNFKNFCLDQFGNEECEGLFNKEGKLINDLYRIKSAEEIINEIYGDVVIPNSTVRDDPQAHFMYKETTENPTGTPTDFNYDSTTSDIVDGKEGIFSLANLTKRVNKLIEKGENETLVKSIKDILVGSEDDSIGGLIGKIGRYIIYACILFFGVKAIWGGVEGKSQFKEVLPYLLAGIVFFFCAEILIKVATNSFSGGQQYEGDGVVSGKVNYDDYGKSLFATIVLLVRILAFGGIMFTGVKLLFATAEQRASIKSHLIPILVGCLFVFASSFIVDTVVKSVKESTGSIGIYEKYELARLYEERRQL